MSLRLSIFLYRSSFYFHIIYESQNKFHPGISPNNIYLCQYHYSTHSTQLCQCNRIYLSIDPHKDFILGIFLWECYNLIRNKYVPIQRYKTILCGLSVLALFTVTVFCYNQFPSTCSLSILWWPSVCAIILYSVVCCPRLLGFRLSVKFGNLSFSFYLLHVLVIYACDMALKKIGLSLMPFPRLIFILTAAVMASTVAHYWFVLPVERYIRNCIKAIQDKNISSL